MSWVVYILELSDGSYYTGITNNLERRLETHRSGKGSRYVRSRLPIVKVAYQESMSTRGEASSREIKIKKLSKSQKKELIRSKEDEC